MTYIREFTVLQKNVTQQCLLHRLFPWLSFIHDYFANIMAKNNTDFDK